MIIEKWIGKNEERHVCDLIWSPILIFSLLEGKNWQSPSIMLRDLNQTPPQHKSKALMLEPPCLVPPVSPIHAHPSYVLFPVHYNIKINSFHVTQYGLPWTVATRAIYSVMVPNNSFPCSQNPTAVQFWVNGQFNWVCIFITYVIYKSLLDKWDLYFSSSHFHWDLLPNQIVARYFFQWPKTSNAFNNWKNNKYIMIILVWKQYFKQVLHCYKNQV